jgi:hypothetical protein
MKGAAFQLAALRRALRHVVSPVRLGRADRGGVVIWVRIVVCTVAALVALACWCAGSATAVASGWSIQQAPKTTTFTFTNNELQSVSCASPTDCTAVGSCTAVAHYNNRAGRELTLVERWDGTSWSIQRTPNPVRASKSSLTGVSCASPTVCTAVGS